MPNDQVKIEFDTLYNGKGADQAVQSIKKVEDSAKKSAGGMVALEDGLKKVNSRMELLNRVMSGFGLIGVITGIVGAVAALKKKFDDAAEAARKITLEKISKDNENAVKGITAEYEALLKSIEAVNVAILRQRELEAARTKNKRDMEDVKDSMSQQDELDKLDRKDPLYKEKASEIRARYKSIATERQSGRESEDLQTKMQLEGDKIKGFRSSEVANRSAAESTWSEYSRQQQQIAGLENPVVKTRDVMRAVGTGRVIKVGEEQYEDTAATKQNKAEAEELRKKLPELEKKARQYVALADEAGNQAAHAANMASTISAARTVSLAKAGVLTQGAASERADAYGSTDAAQEALSKQQDEKRKKDEEEMYQKKAVPVIEQSQAELDAARKRAADARLSEQQAVLARDNADTTFHSSGSRNVLKHESSMAPLQSGASQATAAREKAEREVANLERALKDLMDSYGSAFNRMAQDVKRNTINQKLDATGN